MEKKHAPAMAIFGSSNWDIAVDCYSKVYETGKLIAQKGYTLIYGVGDVGMMGAAYSGARSAGGKVLGVTIPTLLKRRCADPTIFKKGELKLVKTLEERKKIIDYCHGKSIPYVGVTRSPNYYEMEECQVLCENYDRYTLHNTGKGETR